MLKDTPRCPRALSQQRGCMRDDCSVATSGDGSERGWTLLTNHGRILLLIARYPDSRIRDLAAAAGITERSIQMIVTDLEAAGYVARERVGRRNSYTINRAQPFRHPAESDHSIGELSDLFADGPETGGT